MATKTKKAKLAEPTIRVKLVTTDSVAGRYYHMMWIIEIEAIGYYKSLTARLWFPGTDDGGPWTEERIVRYAERLASNRGMELERVYRDDRRDD